MSHPTKRFRYSYRTYTCQYPNCDQDFTSYHALTNHMQTHPALSMTDIGQVMNLGDMDIADISESEPIGNNIHGMLHLAYEY